jgi:hypothetical protein
MYMRLALSPITSKLRLPVACGLLSPIRSSIPFCEPSVPPPKFETHPTPFPCRRLSPKPLVHIRPNLARGTSIATSVPPPDPQTEP